MKKIFNFYFQKGCTEAEGDKGLDHTSTIYLDPKKYSTPLFNSCTEWDKGICILMYSFEVVSYLNWMGGTLSFFKCWRYFCF